MIEITIEMAEQAIRKADSALLKPFGDILEPLEPKERDVMPYVLDLFVNKLTYVNPRDFVMGAFCRKDFLQRDLDRITARLSSDDAKVMDVGCGWGGLTKGLSPETKNLYALDHVREHAIVTKYLCPEARVFQGNAAQIGFEDGTFDFTILRGVIEHVGDHSVPTGPSGPNIRNQFAVVKEVARITKIGGQVALSTGNYLFPRDGESDLWFFHWLPEDRKAAYKLKRGISTDNYWLLTWEELSFIMKTCGLEVKEVYTDTWDRLFDNLEKVFFDIDPDMSEQWRHLSTKDPTFMSSWSLFAVKKESPRAPSLHHSNRCYYARVRGGCQPGTGDELTAENTTLREELERVLTSKSWRYTQPLRSAKSWLVRHLRTLA